MLCQAEISFLLRKIRFFNFFSKNPFNFFREFSLKVKKFQKYNILIVNKTENSFSRAKWVKNNKNEYVAIFFFYSLAFLSHYARLDFLFIWASKKGRKKSFCHINAFEKNFTGKIIHLLVSLFLSWTIFHFFTYVHKFTSYFN